MTEEKFDGFHYEIIAWANSQETIYYHEFGSYQGEWLLVSKDDDNYFIYKGYYGSCSGCDPFQAEFGWNDVTREKAEEFAKNYESFLIVPIDTMQNVCQNNKLLEIIPGNIRDDYGEISLEESSKDITMLVKIKESLPITSLEVLGMTNAEYQQEALASMGYEKFLEEIPDSEIVHEDKHGTLIQASGIVFLSLQDSSTERRYLLRVPPEMIRVRQAIAWTFNLAEDQYNPAIET
jgi:hypothetical protein